MPDHAREPLNIGRKPLFTIKPRLSDSVRLKDQMVSLADANLKQALAPTRRILPLQQNELR